MLSLNSFVCSEDQGITFFQAVKFSLIMFHFSLLQLVIDFGRASRRPMANILGVYR